MNKHWLWVFIPAFFEVGWVIGLKHADTLFGWILTLLSIGISFYGLIMASRSLPVGTVYAVFVGLGTAGTVLSEIILFDEPIKIEKIILILILLVGVIGLKMVTDHEESSVKGADS